MGGASMVHPQRFQRMMDAGMWWLVSLSAGLAVVHGLVLRGWARAWCSAIGHPEGREPTTPSPPVHWSVVVPARNEAHGVGNVLDDLELQKGDFHVFVVDDHSDDGTSKRAKEHGLCHKGRLTVLPNQGQGKKSALLTGLKEATTPWVVTLDADIRLAPDWAVSWQQALDRTTDKVACVAGPVVLASTPSQPRLWEGVQALDYAAQMGWSAGCLARNTPGSASGANLAVRCATYPDTRHLGASGDDTLVVQSLQRAGHEVAWLGDSRAMVSTPGAPSLREWIQQRLRWAQKTVHYAPSAQRTAWWMAFMSAAQWGLWLLALVNPSSEQWAVAWGWWAAITAMNVAYVRPVARWFRLHTSWLHEMVLGLTQPWHMPVLLLGRFGVLRPWGIASKPTWKGRTCDL